jgi:hypothetical protein
MRLIKHHAIRTYDGWISSSTQKWMAVSGHFDALVALSPGKEHPIIISM